MSRPALGLGEWGVTSFTKLPSGRWQAMANYRDYAGKKKRYKASADTKPQAEELMRESLKGPRSMSAKLTKESTVAELIQWWLRKRRQEKLAAGTLENNASDSRYVTAQFGSIRVRELDVLAVEEGILSLAEDEELGPRVAKRSRAVLKQMLDAAAKAGVITVNPVPATTLPYVEQGVPYTLDPAQAMALREGFRAWHLLRDKPGPKPDGRVADMLDLMLGTGLRIGEVLALRTCDIHLDLARPTLTVGATLVDGPKGEPIWQDHPKARRQRRDLVLPELAIEAVRPHMNYKSPGAPLFPNRNGEWMRAGNVRRILRSFREEWSETLEREGIETDKVSPHLLRRTLATMIANVEGVDRAKEQLGHASVQTTERHYVTPPKVAGASTVAIVDGLFRRPSASQPEHDAVEVDEAAWDGIVGR